MKLFKKHPIHKKYAASVDGEIYSFKTNKILKPQDMGNGYKYICIFDRDKEKYRNYYIHRFVWECYQGIITNDKEINHRDENKQNNSISNLELMSRKENVNYSIYKKYKKILSIDLETKEEKIFISIKFAAKELDINPSHISMIYCKRKYCKSATSKLNGQKYSFRYVD